MEISSRPNTKSNPGYLLDTDTIKLISALLLCSSPKNSSNPSLGATKAAALFNAIEQQFGQAFMIKAAEEFDLYCDYDPECDEKTLPKDEGHFFLGHMPGAGSYRNFDGEFCIRI